MKKLFVLILTAVMGLGLMGCGSKLSDLGALYEKCTDLMVPMALVENSELQNTMGINPEDCVQIYVATAEDELLVDEIWIIEAKDREDYERIRELAVKRIQTKSASSITDSPEQHKVASSATIYDHSPYIAMVMSSDLYYVGPVLYEAFE